MCVESTAWQHNRTELVSCSRLINFWVTSKRFPWGFSSFLSFEAAEYVWYFFPSAKPAASTDPIIITINMIYERLLSVVYSFPRRRAASFTLFSLSLSLSLSLFFPD